MLGHGRIVSKTCCFKKAIQATKARSDGLIVLETKFQSSDTEEVGHGEVRVERRIGLSIPLLTLSE